MAVKQAAVGKTYPAVEESVHGGVSFSHGIYVVVRRCYDLRGARLGWRVTRGTSISSRLMPPCWKVSR